MFSITITKPVPREVNRVPAKNSKIITAIGEGIAAIGGGDRLQKGIVGPLGILKVLWNESALFSIAKNIVVGHWGNVTLTVLSLVAQLVAIVTTGGASVLLRLAQCFVALGPTGRRSQRGLRNASGSTIRSYSRKHFSCRASSKIKARAIAFSGPFLTFHVLMNLVACRKQQLL